MVLWSRRRAGVYCGVKMRRLIRRQSGGGADRPPARFTSSANMHPDPCVRQCAHGARGYVDGTFVRIGAQRIPRDPFSSRSDPARHVARESHSRMRFGVFLDRSRGKFPRIFSGIRFRDSPGPLWVFAVRFSGFWFVRDRSRNTRANGRATWILGGLGPTCPWGVVPLSRGLWVG